GVRQDIVHTVLKESKEQGADPLLVFSVMKQESSFDPRAESKAGAKGLMQVMPDTGRGLGVHDPSALMNPAVNVKAGVRYLKEMFTTFSDVAMTEMSLINPFSHSGVKSAIAAYNAGPGNVAKYGGVPPFTETQGYVVKVLDYYRGYRSKLDSI
ncbi:MAG: lytic transglycosylase domain-containing protein, partial [Elusimicrobia bacterium]|nr:lytic transglycosylase domain-containing protein [Elusimicrobiota bacterium]